MNEYRNIDDVLIDATKPFTFDDKRLPTDRSGIPEISDKVSLDTIIGDSMRVEVTGMSDDKSLFMGKVIHGYFPEKQEDEINIGDMVEFSRMKIAGIHKRLPKTSKA